jgi:tellurite resistance protein
MMPNAPIVTQPHPSDLNTQALAGLVSVLAEDAIFAITAAGSALETALEGIAKRRAESYAAQLQGTKLYRMTESFDAWLIELTRAMAPVAPPVWLPMGEVLAEKVTLEIGARGLRSLFSSRPSDKDVQRVKRVGTLAARALRAVLASDGAIDDEEQRTLAAFVGALGLPAEDAALLLKEAPVAVNQLEVYGELDAGVSRALLRGAWLAAAWDMIDPREEEVIRTLAQKLAIAPDEVEEARADAVAAVDSRRAAGLATVDAVRFVLSDRVPGPGVHLAANAGTLVLPRRYREEAMAQVGHGAPVTLAGRHGHLSGEERSAVLGVTWAAALHDDPTIARRALLRARYDRVAHDLGDDGAKARVLVDGWIAEVLAPLATNMR